MPTLSLFAVTASYLIQLGAGIFALSVIGRVLVAAPPRSFAMLEGSYGYDSSAFWEVMPAITAVLLLVALIANWKTRRRGLLLAVLAIFVATGVIMGAVIGPMLSEIVAGGYQDAVDPELQRRAFMWYASDWSAKGLDVTAIVLLIVALTRTPVERA
jgi:MFS family permease